MTGPEYWRPRAVLCAGYTYGEAMGRALRASFRVFLE